MTSKTFCVAPFVGVEILKDGKLAPCCRYLDKEIKPDWVFRNFNQWWNTGLDDLRQELLNDIPSNGCVSCWRDESIGVTSYRQNLNNKFPQYNNLTQPLDLPINQMYNFGNFCNLKCIMCSPFASSQVEAEYEKNQKEFNKIGIQFITDKEIKWYKTSNFVDLKDQLAQQVQSIQLQGGEPLLSPDALNLLRSIPDPSVVDLTVTTNATIVTADIIELLKQFKDVTITVSLEGVGPHNDYLRYGSVWREIENNILALQQSFNTIIAHTFQRTSLQALPGLLQFVEQHNLQIICNLLDWPPYLSVKTASDSERQKFVDQLPEKYRYLEKFVNNIKFEPALEKQFWQYVNLLDQLRGTNVRSVFEY